MNDARHRLNHLLQHARKRLQEATDAAVGDRWEQTRHALTDLAEITHRAQVVANYLDSIDRNTTTPTES